MTNSLLKTIEDDLSKGVNWLEGEAVAAGTLLWDIVKGSFSAFGPGEVQILNDELAEFDKDELAGLSIEEIESRLLTRLGAEELALIEKIASNDLQAFLAAWKSHQAGASS